MSEQNKALTKELYEAVITHGQMDRLQEIVAEDSFDHAAEAFGWQHGFLDHVPWFRGIFPDVVVQVNDMVAEGDRVVAYWSMTGTQQGDLGGVPPTGRKVSSYAISQLRWRDGKLVEYQTFADYLGILVQIGAITDDNPTVQMMSQAAALQAEATRP
jgi:predicted ester cyclase